MMRLPAPNVGAEESCSEFEVWGTGATGIPVPASTMMLPVDEEEDLLVPQAQGGLPGVLSQTNPPPTAGS